jgi:hypothetical protein
MMSAWVRGVGYLHAVKAEAPSILAAAASAFALWASVWLFMRWVTPDTTSTWTLLIVETVATLLAQVTWVRISKEGPDARLPLTWVGMFAMSAVLAVLFLEMDCAGTLHFTAARPTCDRLGGGMSIVFTLGAIAGVLISPPLALRAWLLRKLQAKIDGQ